MTGSQLQELKALATRLAEMLSHVCVDEDIHDTKSMIFQKVDELADLVGTPPKTIGGNPVPLYRWAEAMTERVNEMEKRFNDCMSNAQQDIDDLRGAAAELPPMSAAEPAQLERTWVERLNEQEGTVKRNDEEIKELKRSFEGLLPSSSLESKA